MKLIIISLFLIISLQAVAQIDTLVLVKQSRLAYCNGKIEQAKILQERIVRKDSSITLLNSRIQAKTEEVGQLFADNLAYKTEVDAQKLINKKQEGYITRLHDEVKQLDKKVVTSKFIIGLLILLEIATLVL